VDHRLRHPGVDNEERRGQATFGGLGLTGSIADVIHVLAGQDGMPALSTGPLTRPIVSCEAESKTSRSMRLPSP
jgi:hypothetical protein